MRDNRALRFFRIDDDHPLTGRHVFAIVCLFFGTVFAVNFALAIFATGTFPGLVVKNSYVASQKYNALLAEGRAQEKAGYKAQLTAKAGVLRFHLADASGTALRQLAVSAHAGRPASGREDRALDLLETGKFYQADTALPAGRWIVDVEARDGETLIYRQSLPVWIEAASGSAVSQ
ncbi:MAG TPA: FixH family protein [Afifellaceae bacterium]|nr:FixH family protein [Afifellaceae bacterium]